MSPQVADLTRGRHFTVARCLAPGRAPDGKYDDYNKEQFDCPH